MRTLKRRRAAFGLLAILGFAVGGSLFSLATFADPPASVTYKYDAAGRLLSAAYSDGTAVQYGYDAAGNRISMAQGTLPLLSVSPATVAEGGLVSFTVTKTGTATGTVTVDCIQVPGSATAGADYTANTQTLTFLLADTSKTCSVQTAQDSIYEQNHTFSAVLQNVTGIAGIGTGSAIGTIQDNDAAPVFSVSGGSTTEGGSIAFAISKTGLTDLAHSISYATADGTALTSDNDYTAASSSYTFAPSETSLNVLVPTTSDAKYELNETLTISISIPGNGATLGTSSATGTINNDDAAPSFSINSPTVVNEGAAITFTITKGGNTSTGLTHSFNWATANGTATAPSDYTAGSGVLTFATSDTQKTVQVQTVTDGVADSASIETFVVNLTTNASTNGATLAVSQGTGSIADVDNGTPTVPGNLRTNPVGQTLVNSFQVLWNASTGPVSTYTLQRVSNAGGGSVIATYTINHPTTSRSFTSMTNGEYYFRVCACSSTGQCSAFTPVVMIEVCVGGCN